MRPERSGNIVFTGPGQAEFIEEPLPELGPRQLLIETRRSLISLGTELICYARNFDPNTHWDRWVKYPFHPGYSNAGRVLAVGDEVEEVRVGDRVASRTQHRQYAVIDTTRMLPIPDGISDEDATWFGLAGIVQNAIRRAEHELGDDVAVIGLGPLGQLVVQYARLSGARRVIAIDPVAARLEVAAAHGATDTFAATVDEAHEAVRELTEGRLPDVVYDVTGHPASFPGALRLARRFGKVMLLGDAGRPTEQHLTSDLITRGLRVIGAHDNNPPPVATDHLHWTHRNMARLFFTYLERGQMRVGDLVTHRYEPREAQACYQGVLRDRSTALGVIFEWEGPVG